MWAIDLCAGDGGFTDGLHLAGFRVVAVDVAAYRGCKADVVIYQDLLSLDVRILRCFAPVVAFAGPPCEGYSRHSMPWTRKRNPPTPDTALVRRCFGIADALGVPIVLENVRAAQQWIGPAVTHYGPHYLWGDVPALLPDMSFYSKPKKESYGSRQRHLRARIPIECAFNLACYFMEKQRRAHDARDN